MEGMTLTVYKREDGLWAWHLLAANGQIIATDGGQGYENKGDAIDISTRLFQNHSLRAFNVEEGGI